MFNIAELKLLSGPIIGALIGYGTNYIAVKMLFYPRKQINIFSKHLPFTPGIIPKGKNRMAKALGMAVSEKLLTGDDISNTLLTDTAKRKVFTEILKFLKDDKGIEGQLNEYIGVENTKNVYTKLENILCERIIIGIEKLDIQELIMKSGGDAVKDALKGSMLAMFVNDSLIQKVSGPIGLYVAEYIKNNSYELLLPIVHEEIKKIGEKNLYGLIAGLGTDDSVIEKIVANIYEKVINSLFSKLINSEEISRMVEKKINEMSVVEIENLVLSVMKRELNAIVNLGALIGFILGMLNLFI